jgi:hypothetical protein
MQLEVYDFSWQGAKICLVPSDYDLIADETAFLFAVLDEFSPIFQPLTAELVVNCVDPDDRFPIHSMEVEQSVCYLHTSWLPKELLNTIYINPVNEEISEITIPALSEWIGRACTQNCISCQEYPVDWGELYIQATCAKVVDVEKFGDKQSLRLRCGETGNIVDVPIQRDGERLWVWGIGQFTDSNNVGAPFTVRFSHVPLEFTLEVHWSLWTEPAAQGYKAICEIVQRLVKQGRQVRFASEIFQKDLV